MSLSPNAFTLLELMVAMVIAVAATTMICLTFRSVTRAWRRGTELADDLHHGDFVADQLTLGLRSAYFPNAKGVQGYGFLLEDGGDGEYARDSISWVKRGPAFAATNSPTIAGPHRIKFSVEDDDDGRPAAAVRFWRPYAMLEDFDPETIPPQFISRKVKGFDCRVATNFTDEGWEWESAWEDDSTNTLPGAVELTVYLKPIEEGEEPFVMRRYVEIPVAHLSR